MMEIRPTELKDLPLVMEIYDYARAFMRANGNATQWIDGYPSESFIRQEIEDGHSFVCTRGNIGNFLLYIRRRSYLSEYL